MKVDCVVKNCVIVRHDRCIEGSIAIDKGKIVMMTGTRTYNECSAPGSSLMKPEKSDKSHSDSGISEIGMPEGKREIDAGGRFVIPGLIDPHMHFEWPDWDFVTGTESATKAAAAGGYTTVINHLSGSGSLRELFESRKKIVEQRGYIDTSFHMAVFTEEQIDEISVMAELGVTSFKFFLPYRGSEVVPPLMGIDDGIVYTGFEKIARVGYPGIALVHAENIEIFFKLKSRVLREGKGDRVNWADVRPTICELESIKRIACFSEATGCPVYIVHVSSQEGVEAIREAQVRGIRITGETCPQYLTLTADGVDRILGKVNPPIRREKVHSEMLWKALNTGTLRCIGSDHAPCARKHKQEFWGAVVGVGGIQTVLPVLLSEGVNRGRITINKLVEITSYNTSHIFGLWPEKGALEVGSWADLVILDMGKKEVVKAKNLHHLSDFSLYEGWELTGWPVLTMVRGNIVMEDGEVVGKQGTGKFVPRYPKI